jgi:hypothetical protein
MSWSLKAGDLLRDARCVLHSAIADPDSGEGELKLYGRAVLVDDRIRDSCPGAWWRARPIEAATVFSMHIEEATFIGWETGEGKMRVRRWSARRGYTEAIRSYP